MLPRPASLATLAISVLACSACERATTGSAAHVDRLPTLGVETNARLGDREDPDVGFSRPAFVDVDRDGNVYVLEALVPEIRVYGPDGRLLRRIGRRGAGPGEFEGAPMFGVLGDTVWTVEPGGDCRLTLFDRRGTVLATGRTEGVRVPLPSGFGYVLPWAMRPDGLFTSAFSRVSYTSTSPPSGVEPTDSIPWPLVLFDASGAVTDTIGWVDRPPPRMWRPPEEDDTEYRTVEVGGQRVQVPQPPSTLPRWGALPDGYVSVDTPLPTDGSEGTFTISRIGLHGDTVYSRTLHYDPVPYAAADLDSIAIRAGRGEPGGGVGYVPGRPPPPDWRARANVLRSEMDFPEYRLPVEYPWFARDGSVWLRLTGGDETTARWVLLDPDGRPRGRLELPSDVRILWSRGDTFWAMDPDELDVPWLVRYTLRGETARD